jgi:hypothetical protein
MQVSGVEGYILKEVSRVVKYKKYRIDLTYDSLTLLGRMRQEKTIKFLTKAEISTSPLMFIKFEGQHALELAKSYINAYQKSKG